MNNNWNTFAVLHLRFLTMTFCLEDKTVWGFSHPLGWSLCKGIPSTHTLPPTIPPPCLVVGIRNFEGISGLDRKTISCYFLKDHKQNRDLSSSTTVGWRSILTVTFIIIVETVMRRWPDDLFVVTEVDQVTGDYLKWRSLFFFKFCFLFSFISEKTTRWRPDSKPWGRTSRNWEPGWRSRTTEPPGHGWIGWGGGGEGDYHGTVWCKFPESSVPLSPTCSGFSFSKSTQVNRGVSGDDPSLWKPKLLRLSTDTVTQ